MSNSTAPQNATEPQPPANRESEPVDLLAYLKRLGRYWIAGLVAAVIVAGALFGYGATKSASPVGTTWAKAHVMVTLPDPKTEAQATVEADAASRVMASYVAVEDSDVLMNATAKNLGDGTKVSVLKDATSLYWGGGSQIIAVYALGTDEAQAQKRADAVADALVANAATLLPPTVANVGVPTFTLVEKAAPSSSNPSASSTAGSQVSTLAGSPVVAIVAGVVVGLIVMGIAEVARRRRS